jgi:hypothetical protein
MSDSAAIDRTKLIDTVNATVNTLSAAPNAAAFPTDALRSMLDRIEAATPGGVPLHTQLDTVRKWLGALDRPAEHDRFGGLAHLRAHVATQLRIVVGALEDYQRAQKP